MSEYHKINSVYLRDQTTRNKGFLLGQYTCPEFEMLRGIQWRWKEKVDGTNIRVIWDGEKVTFGGRTNNAQIPAKLFEHLVATFPPEKMAKVFTGPVVIYGEGYGDGIQKGHGYSTEQKFVMFDIAASPYFLNWDNVVGIAAALEVPVVEVVGYGTLNEAEALVRTGFPSFIGCQKAEGLVLTPKVELLTRGGKRIITKLKSRDFN